MYGKNVENGTSFSCDKIKTVCAMTEVLLNEKENIKYQYMYKK